MSDWIPRSVLSDSLGEILKGRRVRTAVFTTFSFDPAFFEQNVLPLLFDQPFSQADKVRQIQLEDALRDLDHLAVYYDRHALAQDAEPARLDVRRIDVRRATGAFHPKVVLLLVDNPPDRDTEEVHSSLIVGTLSANLTRAGWWENVETGHFAEICDRALVPHPKGQKEPFRRDVLALIRRIRSCAPEEEEHEALDAIHQFLIERTTRREPVNTAAAGRWYPRLWCGQESLADFLRSRRLQYWNLNLEVISPYFDTHDVGTLDRVIEAVAPREVRVHLPRDADGHGLVSPEIHDAVAAVAQWSELPGDLLQRQSGASSEKLAPRRVHAKVYRFWARDQSDVLLVGSPNLTQAAHGAHGGNLEAAFFVDVTDGARTRRWWLEPLEQSPAALEHRPPEEEVEESPIELSLRFDWSNETLYTRVERNLEEAVALKDPAGPLLGHIDQLSAGGWTKVDMDLAAQVQELLARTSFVRLEQGEHHWRVLVREEGMAHKPSLLSQLTPEEILRYWSLLTAEQKAHFIEERLAADGTLEGLPVSRPERLGPTDTFFDRFAGLYHAFGRLRETVTTALEESRERDAEARLLGAKYDSLPVLLRRYLESDQADPVLRYVAFLCAKQLWELVRKQYPGFHAEYRLQAAELEELLGHLPHLRATLGLGDDREADEFLDWFERHFLRWARVPEGVE